MAEFATLTDVLARSVAQAGEESSMLLGQTLTFEPGDSLKTNRVSYFTGLDSAILVATVESKEEYPGEFYLLFTLRDAILMSGLLLGIPPARISEKRKLAIVENDDTDAFGEIMNQLIGSFNMIFKPSFPNKVHLKLVKPKKYVPDVDPITEVDPVPDGEFLLFRTAPKMDGYEMDHLDILVPLPLAELFDPPPAVEEKPADEVAEEAPPAATAADETVAVSEEETIIILEDNQQEREKMRECLASTGLKLLDAALNADIRELLQQGRPRVAVVGVADTEDRELALCIKISSLSQDQPLPIIMCAPEWTRSGVLKAIKYGARDIVLKPYSGEELIAKVRKFLKAA
jgi:CheY-like chemotaxis protein